MDFQCRRRLSNAGAKIFSSSFNFRPEPQIHIARIHKYSEQDLVENWYYICGSDIQFIHPGKKVGHRQLTKATTMPKVSALRL